MATTYLILLLAQTCVSEISLQSDTRECILMWAINDRAASRKMRTLEEQTLLYNAYWKNLRMGRVVSRPWIQHLTNNDTQPKGWPKKVSWKLHKKLWLKYVAAAKEYLYNTSKYFHVCSAADTYGGPTTLDPKPCDKAKKVRCLPNAHQTYWNTSACRW